MSKWHSAINLTLVSNIETISPTIHMQHCLPELDCTEGECIADFNIRQKTRLTYPGACSLEYQNIIKIVIEDLLQWDIKKQCAKGKGILGTLMAFAPADEAQGRKTLHSHWQA